MPVASVLRDHLVDHQLRTCRKSGLIFGSTVAGPFNPRGLTKRADDAWEAAELERITLHECRHSFASPMIAAGVNAKALSTYMGHANISITLDRCGHLMPGSEGEAAGLLDGYLAQEQKAADERARAATGAQSGAQQSEEALEPLG